MLLLAADLPAQSVKHALAAHRAANRAKHRWSDFVSDGDEECNEVPPSVPLQQPCVAASSQCVAWSSNVMSNEGLEWQNAVVAIMQPCLALVDESSLLERVHVLAELKAIQANVIDDLGSSHPCFC